MVRQGSSWSGRERNCVMLNCGTDGGNSALPFADVSAISGLDFADDGRAVAVVDWDHDGDLDLWFRNRTAPRLRLMVNQTNKKRAKNSVACRLQAITGNRDAIGARVEFHLQNQPVVVKTLTAGDGFLSQSSKWLHFGLGTSSQIERVIVYWPTGEAESFSGIEPGGRYHLKQGAAKAVTWNREEVPSGLTAAVQSSSSDTARSAISLPAKIPLPVIEYLDSAEKAQQVTTAGRPKLLVFWASWCPSCIQELQDLKHHADQLATNELDVLALAVDQASASSSNPLAAKSLIERLQLPFAHGSASERAIEKIQHFRRSLYENVGPFSVPLSFLLDRKGRVVSIYQGPVAIDTLLRDVRSLDAEGNQRRDLALPYAGRWFTLPITPSAAAEFVGKQFIENYPSDAALFYDTAAKVATDTHRRSSMAAVSAALYLQVAHQLASEGSLQKSKACFLKSIYADPSSVESHLHFGIFLMRSREFELAQRHLLRVLELAPNDERARQALSRVRQQQANNL